MCRKEYLLVAPQGALRKQDVLPKAVPGGWAGDHSPGSSARFKEPVLGGSCAALCQVLAGQLKVALKVAHQLPRIAPSSGCVTSAK